MMSLQRLLARLRAKMAASRDDHSGGPAGGGSPAGRSGESGMAAIEFALIAPLFLMIVFGILIYGGFFGTWIAISQAAAEGARASVAGMSTQERRDLANAAALRVLNNYGVLLEAKRWTITPGPGSDAHTFQVKVKYDLTDRNFAKYLDLKLLPSSEPTATATVGLGGY